MSGAAGLWECGGLPPLCEPDACIGESTGLTLADVLELLLRYE